MKAKAGKQLIRCRLGVSAMLLGLLFSNSLLANESSYRIGKPADWIQIASVPDEAANVDRLAKKGIYYKLLDRQINAIDPADRSMYRAVEFKLTNKTGVTNNSTIEIDFDPIYESVVLHELGIFRNGEYIDKLQSTDIQLLRTENELENLFYNGTLSLTAILQDVRVNDVIRYSYTFEGTNPVYDELIEHRVSNQYYIHMAKYSFRLLVNADTPMTLRTRDLPVAPNIIETLDGGVRTYSWAELNLKPLDWEDDEPSWTVKSPAFSISSVGSWEDIVNWALPKYKHADVESNELRLVAKAIKEQHKTEQARVGAALRWVQDEIRYFGVELGENSHNPSTADETLSRRYGDCKDKSVVLISLLSELGIDAHPALVNTDGDLRSDEYLFRLHAFDHVIVHLNIDGKSHWIDPTRQNQQGALGEIYEPNYGSALILKDGQTDLTSMSMSNSEHRYHSTKRFILNKEDNDLATLNVKTKRQGLSAEQYRGNLSNRGMSSMQDDYLDYYRETFDYINSVGDLQYEEQEKNRSESIEDYALEEFWDVDDDNIEYFRIVADETRHYLHAPKAAKYRKRPYSIGHPNIITDVSVFLLADGIENNTGSKTISNDYFTYSVNVEQNGESNSVVVTHRYESHALSVAVEDIPSYAQAVEDARELSILYLEKSGFDFGEDIEADVSQSNKVAQNSDITALDFFKAVFLGKRLAQ